jgi:hypothetical protein
MQLYLVISISPHSHMSSQPTIHLSITSLVWCASKQASTLKQKRISCVHLIWRHQHMYVHKNIHTLSLHFDWSNSSQTFLAFLHPYIVTFSAVCLVFIFSSFINAHSVAQAHGRQPCSIWAERSNTNSITHIPTQIQTKA